mmetsp:Transcript_3580/g.3765  ORF Transcript_3580/g.3765 Transcript_3580/m.3765 type:complete len:97 (+) Transcript_3580:29-319(+)
MILLMIHPFQVHRFFTTATPILTLDSVSELIPKVYTIIWWFYVYFNNLMTSGVITTNISRRLLGSIDPFDTDTTAAVILLLLIMMLLLLCRFCFRQ